VKPWPTGRMSKASVGHKRAVVPLPRSDQWIRLDNHPHHSDQVVYRTGDVLQLTHGRCVMFNFTATETAALKFLFEEPAISKRDFAIRMSSAGILGSARYFETVYTIIMSKLHASTPRQLREKLADFKFD